jgi:hypothetical protein
MMFILAGVAFWLFGCLCAWSLCRAAADGDRYTHDAWERKDQG